MTDIHPAAGERVVKRWFARFMIQSRFPKRNFVVEDFLQLFLW